MGYERFKQQCNVLDKYLESAGRLLLGDGRWSERGWLLGRRRSADLDRDILHLLVWDTGDWKYEEMDDEGEHLSPVEWISTDDIPEILARNTGIRLKHEERELFTLKEEDLL